LFQRKQFWIKAVQANVVFVAAMKHRASQQSTMIQKIVSELMVSFTPAIEVILFTAIFSSLLAHQTM